MDGWQQATILLLVHACIGKLCHLFFIVREVVPLRGRINVQKENARERERAKSKEQPPNRSFECGIAIFLPNKQT